MPTENTVTISVERFQQLIQAEHDANQLKTLISDKYKHYGSIDRPMLCLLHSIYFGNEEDTEE